MINRVLKAIIPEYSDEQIINSSYIFSFKFFIHLIWLFSCTFLVFYLEIEKNKGFDKVALVLTSAFLLYIFVPLKFRKLFLVLLAFVVETYLFGIKISTGVLLFIIYFVGLTYIPNKKVRLAVVIISVIGAMLITSKVIVVPYARIIIMFGALFLMLRYIYLLYEINYFRKPPVFIDRLCYLFLIPNACFPLFPALSPVEYLNVFYNKSSETTLKRGLHWVTVGIIHLLIYRIIYLYLSPSPYDIDSFGMWLWFILSSYSLIFRLSGLFYLAMGFLQLFGFNMPNIFNHVYFASGFPDLWRRVNLYWRAFMTRVFYYPLVFKLKKINQKFVVWSVTLFMFACTWLLHSWQWYWIKGSYYFYPADMLFWFILGIIISYNAVKAFNRLNNVSGDKRNQNYFAEASKIIFMFFAMSLLWSLWTASSLTEFVYIIRFVASGTVNEYLIFIGVTMVVVLLAGIIRTLYYKRNWFAFIFSETTPIFGIGFCLIIFSSLEVLKQNNLKEEAKSFISMSINNRDKILLERGYYEQILNNDDKSIELLNIGSKFKKWNLDRDAYQKTNNELMKEFIPNYKTTFKGDTLSTNSFGLRDKEYNLEKEDGVIRLAFVGGSYIMGSGVSNEENFAAVIEEKLNSGNKKIEVLNYGVGGYFLIQNVFVVQHKVPEYKPDYLFSFIHSSYRVRCLDNYANLLMKNVSITDPYLKDVAEKAGIRKGMCHLEIYNRLKPHLNKIITWGYKTIYETCKKENIIPVMVYLPANASLKEDDDKEFCLSQASKLGFYIIDLSGVYAGQDPDKIQISSWDTHPNEKGHQLISDLLFEKLKKDKQFFKFMD
jgi:hypothetical protein